MCSCLLLVRGLFLNDADLILQLVQGALQHHVARDVAFSKFLDRVLVVVLSGGFLVIAFLDLPAGSLVISLEEQLTFGFFREHFLDLFRGIAVILGKQVREKHLDRFPVLMTVLQDVNPGIAGIIAGRLTEEHNRPSIVLTPKMGREGVLVGSCRSVPEINIKALLDEISDLMMAYGGHAGAAGLTLEKAAVPAFFQALIRAEKELFTYVPADVDIRFYDLSADTGMCGSLAAEEKRFMPYGEGCEQNIYRITGYIPDTDLFTGKRVSVFGKDNKVYKMTCRGVSAITFDQELGEALKGTDGEMVLYGTLSQNEYKGNIRPQITVEWFEKA